jgi:hypothetical protein
MWNRTSGWVGNIRGSEAGYHRLFLQTYECMKKARKVHHLAGFFI